MTKVGALILVSSARWSMSRIASQQPEYPSSISFNGKFRDECNIRAILAIVTGSRSMNSLLNHRSIVGPAKAAMPRSRTNATRSSQTC